MRCNYLTEIEQLLFHYAYLMESMPLVFLGILMTINASYICIFGIIKITSAT